MALTFRPSFLSRSLLIAGIVLASSVSPAIAQNRTAWLQDNGSTKITGYLLEGESIQGLCDSACKDLDLFLYNEMGLLVDSDEAIDPMPLVSAPYEGTFAIELSMPSCTHWAGCSASISSDYGF